MFTSDYHGYHHTEVQDDRSDEFGSHDGYHGYHERGRTSLDSKWTPRRHVLALLWRWTRIHKSLKQEGLSVVARDGIEPPGINVMG